jgi:hypothetical protein
MVNFTFNSMRVDCVIKVYFLKKEKVRKKNLAELFRKNNQKGIFSLFKIQNPP